MVILEKPYVSDLLLDYLEDSGVAVLKNDVAESLCASRNINLLSEDDFALAMKEQKKLYTVSENALGWFYANSDDAELKNSVSLMKDKAEFRKACAPLFPDFFFREVSANELDSLDAGFLRYPFVLKPSVGFLSAGVYVVENEADWHAALKDLKGAFASVCSQFPDEVVQSGKFILEEYIKGDEYAVDTYFDEAGEPVVLNIFSHPFNSGKDVSDRLYMTSKTIFDKNKDLIYRFLKRVSVLLKLRNVPVHIELRIDDGEVRPIEFNPMRFAGMCLNELFYHIYGKHPLEVFFKSENVDYEKMWEGKENDIFSFVVLEKSVENAENELDEDKIRAIIENVLEIRLLDRTNLNTFGLLFVRTSGDNPDEIQKILSMDVASVLK